MLIGRVVDQLFATQKESVFEGRRLLLVQPLNLDGGEQGEPVLAVEGVDAGIGDRVLLAQEGWCAMHVVGRFRTPVDAAVMGVIDRIDLDDSPRA